MDIVWFVYIINVGNIYESTMDAIRDIQKTNDSSWHFMQPQWFFSPVKLRCAARDPILVFKNKTHNGRDVVPKNM